MANGVYGIPRKLKDEDKWFKFFTKIQLMIFGIGVAISLVFAVLLFPLKAYHLWVVLTVIVLVLAGFLALVPMPNSRYLYGGGYPLYVIVIRLINKIISKKRLYIKNYDAEDGSV